MRTVKLLSVIFLCLSLVSCSASSGTPDLPLSRFVCKFSWTSGGESFTASLSSCPAVDGRRDYVMRILSPSSLSGLSVISENGIALLYMGDSPIGSAPKGYTDIASLLLPLSPLSYLCKAKIGGAKAICYISGGTRWYYSSDRSTPLLVESGGLSLDIIRMERP